MGEVPVGTEDGRVGGPSQLRPVNVPGHEKPGQALEDDILDAIAVMVPPAVDDRVERAFFGRGQEPGTSQNAFADATGPPAPLSVGRIAAGEFGQLMLGRRLAQVVALAELGLTDRTLMGLPEREQPKQKAGC